MLEAGSLHDFIASRTVLKLIMSANETSTAQMSPNNAHDAHNRQTGPKLERSALPDIIIRAEKSSSPFYAATERRAFPRVIFIPKHSSHSIGLSSTSSTHIIELDSPDMFMTLLAGLVKHAI